MKTKRTHVTSYVPFHRGLLIFWLWLLLFSLNVAQMIRTQATDCAPAPPGLVAWWPGDGDANDIAGSNNGVLMNGATATSPGLSGQAFSFDGIDSCVLLPNLVQSQPEGTVEGWIKLHTWNWASAPDGRYFWASTQYLPDSGSSWDGADFGTHPGFSRTGGELMSGLESNTGSWEWAFSGVVPQTNVWYHVAGTWGANGINLYVNGLLQGSNPYTGPAPDYLEHSLLGRSSWPNSVTDGLIDEFSLYDRALSASEIAAIYAAGGAAKCKQPFITVQPESQTGGVVTFTWNAFAGKTYRMQYTTDLTVGNWHDLGTSITATDGSATGSDTVSGAVGRRDGST